MRCRLCGFVLPGWLPVPNCPDGAMLLNHLVADHLAEAKGYLDRMRTEDIGTTAMEAYERIEDWQLTAERLARMTPEALRAAIDEALAC